MTEQVKIRTRYDAVKERLSSLPKSSLKICKASACACTGCAGEVNGTKIRQHELDKFMKGEL
jgi:hypothetical protein